MIHKCKPKKNEKFGKFLKKNFFHHKKWFWLINHKIFVKRGNKPHKWTGLTECFRFNFGTILVVSPKKREAAEKIFSTYHQKGTNRKLSVRSVHLWGLLPLLTNILWFISQNHNLWSKQFFFKNFHIFSLFFGFDLCMMPYQPLMTSLWFPHTK